MSVIINDFEVVVEPPPERPQPAEAPTAPETSSLKPADVRRVMRRRSDRLARVWAH